MGTSSSGGGASGSNPLIPAWIPPIGNPPSQDPVEDNEDQGDGGNRPVPDQKPPDAIPVPVTVASPGRYRQPKSDFNKFVKSGGADKSAFSSALKGYSRSGGGSTQILARRMRPSAIRVGNFYGAINTIRDEGLPVALRVFNLTTYENKSVLDTLSALSDIIFQDRGEAYENTQDDSITKLAYANTVTRICEEIEIDLNNLTNEQIEVMTAIFIEETIAQRVICDLGNQLPSLETNVEKLLEIEDNAYQIVSGLVRNNIMPEIIASQRGESKDLDAKIENIYRLAFDALGGIK